MEGAARGQFPHLNALASSMELVGCGGYDDCYDISNQTKEQQGQLLAILGADVSLFNKYEKRDPDKREKFLKRVRRAAKHLLEVYYKEEADPDVESFSLSQHPSHGMKESADRVYKTLERHWRCSCSQRAARLTGPREARLNLARHRQFAPKTTTRTDSRRANVPAIFEILLPVCKDSVEWKITNIEVKNAT